LFLGLAHCNLVGGSILRLVNLSYLPLIVYWCYVMKFII
jgi:hypothetical protein